MLKSIILLSCFIALAFAICEDKCGSVPHMKYYKELGCKPVYEEGNSCPVRYECMTSTGFSTEHCYFNGFNYSVGQLVENEVSDQICVADCYCHHYGLFDCAHIECPEMFMPNRNPGCILQYKKNVCCSTGKVCGKNKNKLATCTLEGRTYFEGEKMRPTAKNCYTCICTKDFKTTTIEENPNCWEINCATQFHYMDYLRKGCVPIYYGQKTCCPFEWRCPDNKDSIVPKVISTDPNMKCKFGDLELNIGDKVSSNDQGVECSCTIPPMVECLKN